MKTISSQRYRDPAIVAKKSAAQDYTAYYVEVEIDGEDFRVVVDGHHSLEAAKQDGAEVDWEHLVELQPSEAPQAVQDFLIQHWMDSDYYDVDTGLAVW